MTAMKPQKSRARPPSMRTNTNWLRDILDSVIMTDDTDDHAHGSKTSQLAIAVLANPSMVMNLKFRCSVVS